MIVKINYFYRIKNYINFKNTWRWDYYSVWTRVILTFFRFLREMHLMQSQKKKNAEATEQKKRMHNADSKIHMMISEDWIHFPWLGLCFQTVDDRELENIAHGNHTTNRKRPHKDILKFKFSANSCTYFFTNIHSHKTFF